MKIRGKNVKTTQKWWGVQDVEIRVFVNDLINQFPCRIFQVNDGFIYWLVDHHKYINYKRAAKRVRLGRTNGEAPHEFNYLTHKI